MENKRASETVPQRQSKRCKNCHQPETSTADLHSGYGAPISLNLGSKVFLSHSGRDKDFVRRLYEELHRVYLGFGVAFFDEETLPKGKVINMEKSILEEAKKAQLGVLVLTDDFFMHTRNPMLELEAFVAGEVCLLPLFLTMSVEEFKEKERQDRWQKRWEEWAAADDKLVIEKWRSYLEDVRGHNGLEFCKIAPTQRQDLFINEVVKTVARIIGPTIKMCGQDVYGMESLCQAVDAFYKTSLSGRSSLISSMPHQDASTSTNPGLLQNDYLWACDVVGIYGFPGVGKTTLCYGLCDYFFGDMKGRVCYIDVADPQHNEVSRMKRVLSRLGGDTTTNLQTDKNEMTNQLIERLSSTKDPIFLAIDHLLPINKSKDEVLMYLRFPYPEGSKIFITSRAQSSLKNLISLVIPQQCSFLPVIECMPTLDFKVARSIFKHEIPSLISARAATDKNLETDVRKCVDMCTISYEKSCRYHPLMLKSVAAFIAHDESTLPGLDHHWKKKLRMVASEGIHCEEYACKERVFQFLDKSYELLAENEKKVFLGLAICYKAMSFYVDFYESIKMFHLTDKQTAKRDFEKIIVKLQKFRFIEEGSRTELSVHSLMLAFAKYKLADAYVVSEKAARLPTYGSRAARHVSIASCMIEESRKLDLRHERGMEVLHLIGNEKLDEVLLSHKTTAQLRSMIVTVPKPATATLRFTVNEDYSEDYSMPSLTVFYLEGDVNFCLRPSPARRKFDCGWFRNLEVLALKGFCSTLRILDLSRCASLKLLTVHENAGLTSIRGPESSLLLAKVTIKALHDLQELVFTVPADSKTQFVILFCPSLESFSLNYASSSSSYFAGKPVVGSFFFENTPLLRHVDGLSQYTGLFHYNSFVVVDDEETMSSSDDALMLSSCAEQSSSVTGLFRILEKLNEARSVDLSQAKAKIIELILRACADSLALAKVMRLTLVHAQHIGPLISAIFQARPTHLYNLSILCQQDGDCFCDQNAPTFGNLPLILEDFTEVYPDCQGRTDELCPKFRYSCPQVKDLTSLDKWETLQFLSLKGCTSVEKWPNFALMTSLRVLDLRKTSLRKWPAGLHLLPHLKGLLLSSCPDLPAKELILPVISNDSDSERDVFIRSCALQSLLEDLRLKERDMRSVADALWELSAAERVVFFERSTACITSINISWIYWWNNC